MSYLFHIRIIVFGPLKNLGSQANGKKKQKRGKQRPNKSIIVIIGLIAFLAIGISYLDDINVRQLEGGNRINEKEEITEVNLSEFVARYNSGTFERIELIDTTDLRGFEESYITGASAAISGLITQTEIIPVYTAKKPIGTSIKDLGFTLTGDQAPPIEQTYTTTNVFTRVFFDTLLPLIGVVLVFVLLMKFMMPKGGGMPFMSQMSKPKTSADIKQKFHDVAGMDEAKNELEEIVEYLKNPKKFVKAGAKIPRGVLLYGLPGGGKTLLARAVAGEAGVSFFATSGSEFMEMLVGLGASKVRDLFRRAKAAGSSIIFIDEIDAIGKKRGAGMTGGHQEQEQTLNQILTEMDGFDKDSGVIVIAATNRPDTLDPALLRPGRFDRKVYVGKPTLEERIKILEVHAKNKKFTDNVDFMTISRRTSGFVGADLENLLNEAALFAAKNDRSVINEKDLEYALEKIVMGPEKKIKSLNKQEKNIITYHELGHAITAHILPEADPVEKISIVSRGMALGVTWMMPKEDRYLFSKRKFLDELVTLLGGRAAEDIFFGKDQITTGASNDFQRAKKIAFDMVAKYGMDEELGPVMYYDESQSDYVPYRQYSERTAELIDDKVSAILQKAYAHALEILTTNRDKMEKLAQILLMREYLSKNEFERFMNNKGLLEEFITKWQTSQDSVEDDDDEQLKVLTTLFTEMFANDESKD